MTDDRPRPSWWPNHAEDALVKELVDACIRGDGFNELYLQFCDERDRMVAASPRQWQLAWRPSFGKSATSLRW